MAALIVCVVELGGLVDKPIGVVYLALCSSCVLDFLLLGLFIL